MNTYESNWWSIEVACGWLAEEKPGCVTFCREDGVGALQISAYKHEARGDLHGFTKYEFPEGLTVQPASCGKFIGQGVDYCGWQLLVEAMVA